MTEENRLAGSAEALPKSRCVADFLFALPFNVLEAYRSPWRP